MTGGTGEIAPGGAPTLATALWERGAELATDFLAACQRFAHGGSSVFLLNRVESTRSGSPRSCHSMFSSRSVTRRLAAGDKICREKSVGETRSYSASEIRVSPFRCDPGVANSKSSTRPGTAVRAISKKASTRPAITKLFHRPPLLSKDSATGSDGFSWKPRTWDRLPSIVAPTSIHPYSTSGAFGRAPNNTIDLDRSSAVSKADSSASVNKRSLE